VNNCRIVIFAKAPVAGFAKTRLIPALGAEGAASLAHRLLDHAIRQALDAAVGSVELCMTPADEAAWKDVTLPVSVMRSAQGDGDLGPRMARASERVIADGESIILTGTDCPALDAQCLRQIARGLGEADTVMVPAADGGYVALGLNRFHPTLFTGIAWSTRAVAFQTRRRIAGLGWSIRQLPALHDIDLASDLRWLPGGLIPADMQLKKCM
jgi:rSAM/selenodomain-associated transferase 1